MRKHVLIIPDGAADINRLAGCSPLEYADLPGMDFIARKGVSGLMQTLYPELPRGSMVAQLGMLGWDPRIYFPGGRASAELLACCGKDLNVGDLAFRANLARMNGRTLESYNADFIASSAAKSLILKICSQLLGQFPTFELYHNSDFRNTLVVRQAVVSAELLDCPEPHEHQGREFDLTCWVRAIRPEVDSLADRLNAYIIAVGKLLQGEKANVLLPWSPSRRLRLPPFRKWANMSGPTAIVGFMDFLVGIALAGDIDFIRVGNGRPDTDYAAKGQTVISLLKQGYTCVICHINGPDEASHMGDIHAKIRSLEQIDTHIVSPVVRHFENHPEDLGSVMIAPDHYSNTILASEGTKRSEAHSLQPVPFALWNGNERDGCTCFCEAEAPYGKYGKIPVSHLDLLSLLIHEYQRI